MLTSARNELSGKVSAIETGAVNDEVEITLADGQKVVAVVTRSSTKALNLDVGTDAIALIKTSWVILLPAASGLRLSARNQLTGKVAKIVPGAINTEVTVTLPAGGNIVATITNDSVGNLGLAPDAAVTAAFKASSVIVGVKA
jgi:molybdate transport system regulatory protein